MREVKKKVKTLYKHDARVYGRTGCAQQGKYTNGRGQTEHEKEETWLFHYRTAESGGKKLVYFQSKMTCLSALRAVALRHMSMDAGATAIPARRSLSGIHVGSELAQRDNSHTISRSFLHPPSASHNIKR